MTIVTGLSVRSEIPPLRAFSARNLGFQDHGSTASTAYLDASEVLDGSREGGRPELPQIPSADDTNPEPPLRPQSHFKGRWCVLSSSQSFGALKTKYEPATADSWRGIWPSLRPGSSRFRFPLAQKSRLNGRLRSQRSAQQTGPPIPSPTGRLGWDPFLLGLLSEPPKCDGRQSGSGVPRRHCRKVRKQGPVSCSTSLAFSIVSVRWRPLLSA